MRFDTLLVANRGEIACRVLRSARAAGLRTVAVYSEADAGAPHVALADDAVCIGPGPVTDSYLVADAILEAAAKTGAGAIHPGYGFLSENADFVRAVTEAGLIFVGPPPSAIEVMGDKAGSKRAMIAAGVPCVPGYQGDDQSDATLLAEAEKIGVPVMVKASAGGGGRGMRLVTDAAELPDAIARARSEALTGFGSDKLILEKAIMAPRHVEIQVMADGHGNCVYLGERDCSVQRRHQKVVEEAPCPVLPEETRRAMGEAAVAAAQAVDYVGAGTVEFLYDDTGAFYFLEMNTRLQVEHPVTEMVTGLDLVALQLSVAQGAALPLTQSDVALNGHAMEVRLYAEDPTNDFLPQTGKLALWAPAAGEGMRVDAGIETGQDIAPFYDPMLAKIIAHGPDRDTARARLIAALEQTACLGVTTNRGFLIDILRNETFAAGDATTALIGTDWPDGVKAQAPGTDAMAIGSALLLERESRLRQNQAMADVDALVSFTSDAAAMSILDVAIGDDVATLTARHTGTGWNLSGEEWYHQVNISAFDPTHATLSCDGVGHRIQYALDARGLFFTLGGQDLLIQRHQPWAAADAEGDGSLIRAPMPGMVVSMDVAAGDTVEKGQTLAVLEAMKMQHQLLASAPGRIAEVMSAEGAQVSAGEVLIALEISE